MKLRKFWTISKFSQNFSSNFYHLVYFSTHVQNKYRSKKKHNKTRSGRTKTSHSTGSRSIPKFFFSIKINLHTHKHTRTLIKPSIFHRETRASKTSSTFKKPYIQTVSKLTSFFGGDIVLPRCGGRKHRDWNKTLKKEKKNYFEFCHGVKFEGFRSVYALWNFCEKFFSKQLDVSHWNLVLPFSCHCLEKIFFCNGIFCVKFFDEI